MIKNFLYSLFLHFLLLLVIYANFNLKEVDEGKTSEIAVSLVSMTGDENSDNLKPGDSGDKIPEEKEVKKEAKEETSIKKSAKNQLKETPKKLAKAKPSQAVKKAPLKEKIEEFKAEEKESPKQEESPKIKDDKLINENEDEKQEDKNRQEKILGSIKQSEQNQEASSDKNQNKIRASDLANSLENIDLSAREKFNIQSQLKRCYRRAIDETKLDSKFSLVIKVQISEDGYLDSNLDELLDMKRYNDPQETAYKITVDNVRRALDLCSPLRNLPLDKYEIWKEVVLDFNEEK